MRAIVCSGGANRGALQVGALETLLAANVVPELLVGTSVGAVNAAFLAAGPTPARVHELADLWRKLRTADIFPGSRLRQLINLTRRAEHVCSPQGLRSLLERHLPYRGIEDAAVPLVVVATDLSTGTERRLNQGPVVEAVLASAAIPGIFPPVAWYGELLIDGGIAANVPLGAALAAGADDIWVLDANQPCHSARSPRSAVDIALQALALIGTARLQAELACPPRAATIHHVPLSCATPRWFSDFSGTEELLTDGARAAEKALTSETQP